MAAFINEGHFDRHLRKLRQIYNSRRDCLVAALEINFNQPVILGQESDLHLVWQLPEGYPSARDIQSKARESNVGNYALSSGAAFDFDTTAKDDMLVFGYSSLAEPQIEAAISKMRLMLEGQTISAV